MSEIISPPSPPLSTSALQTAPSRRQSSPRLGSKKCSSDARQRLSASSGSSRVRLQGGIGRENITAAASRGTATAGRQSARFGGGVRSPVKTSCGVPNAAPQLPLLLGCRALSQPPPPMGLDHRRRVRGGAQSLALLALAARARQNLLSGGAVRGCACPPSRNGWAAACRSVRRQRARPGMSRGRARANRIHARLRQRCTHAARAGAASPNQTTGRGTYLVARSLAFAAAAKPDLAGPRLAREEHGRAPGRGRRSRDRALPRVRAPRGVRNPRLRQAIRFRPTGGPTGMRQSQSPAENGVTVKACF